MPSSKERFEETERRLSHQEHKEVTSILANERTYAAWLRTGLTALATSLGSQAFLSHILGRVYLNLLSSVLSLFSILCFFLAAWRYRHVGNRLAETNVFGAPIFLLVFCSSLLILITFVNLIGIWVKAES